MGLDMYLTLKIDNVLPVDESRGDPQWDYEFLSGFDFSDTHDRFWAVVDNYDLRPLIDEDSPMMQIYRDGSVEFNVAYWRKQNAIHAWFVDTIQNGEDDCAKYVVHIEQLAHLVGICRTILTDPFKAESLLAPRSGFFFGSTDLDEWYFAGVKYTAERLKYVLEKSISLRHSSPALSYKKASFYYQSSW